MKAQKDSKYGGKYGVDGIEPMTFDYICQCFNHCTLFVHIAYVVVYHVYVCTTHDFDLTFLMSVYQLRPKTLVDWF
jgi:hypothetical protein